MAQTTPDASFGPVFVVTAFHHSCRVFCRVQPICMLVSTEKNNRFKKKTYLGPKRCILHRLGSFSFLPFAYTYAVLSKYMQNLKMIN